MSFTRKSLAVSLLLFSTLGAHTVTSEFLRIVSRYEDAEFPLNLEGYLDVTFRVMLLKGLPKGVRAQVDRNFAGDTEASYTGDFTYGEKKPVIYADGKLGPSILFESPKS